MCACVCVMGKVRVCEREGGCECVCVLESVCVMGRVCVSERERGRV